MWERNKMTFFKNFMNDESGASAAEYALILVVVGVGIVAAASGLAEAIEGGMETAAKNINPDAAPAEPVDPDA